MNDQRRNQLIGGIAIVLIAVILSPYVIKDKRLNAPQSISLVHSDNRDLEAENSDTDGQLDPQVIAELTQPATEPAPTVIPSEPSVPPVPAEPAPVVEPQAPQQSHSMAVTEKMYSIQLAALKNRQKIEELVALLRLHNYDVYLDPKQPAANQTIRLLVGPYPSKKQADMVILDLKNLTKLNGFIVTR